MFARNLRHTNRFFSRTAKQSRMPWPMRAWGWFLATQITCTIGIEYLCYREMEIERKLENARFAKQKPEFEAQKVQYEVQKLTAKASLVQAKSSA